MLQNLQEGKKPTILAVDDEPAIRESFSQMLGEMYDVILAESGEDAIEKVKKFSPDLILMDQILPGMSGLEVIEELRKFNYKTPIIMVSVIQEVKTTVNAIKLGVYDYVNKPFKISELQRIIEQALHEDSPKQKEHKIGASTLFSLTSDMAAGINLERAINNVMDIVMQIVPCDTVALMTIDRDSDRIVTKIWKGLNKTLRSIISLKVGEGIAGWVAKEGKPLLLVDNLKDYPHFRWTPEGKDLKSAIYAPLKVNDKVIGILNLNRITTDFNFTDTDMQLACILANQAALAIGNAQLQLDLEHSCLETITVLAKLIEAHDTYTSGHSERITQYALLLGREIGMTQQELKNLEYAALLHDIGKVSIDRTILEKKGTLTHEEWDKIKSHPLVGREILKPLNILKDVLPTIYYHHERYNGNGYLGIVKGEEIPLGARIISIADAFDAMSSPRPYRDALPLDKIKAELENGSGTQFDPKLVAVFLRLLNEGKVQILHSGELPNGMSTLKPKEKDVWQPPGDSKEHIRADFEEAGKVRYDFNAILSHELQTPLTTIKEGVEIVLDGITGRINKAQRGCLSIVKEDIGRLTEAVRDILTLIRIEGGNIILNRGYVDIINLVKEEIDSLSCHVISKGIRVETQFDESINRRLHIDEGKIAIVINNLFHNAVKFISERGTITVKVYPSSKDGFVEIAVEDTGTGIPSHKLGSVFNKFQFAHNPYTGNTKGLGLGLYICKHFVEAHGGEIRVESQPAKGSKFTFTLPAWQENRLQ